MSYTVTVSIVACEMCILQSKDQKAQRICVLSVRLRLKTCIPRFAKLLFSLLCTDVLEHPDVKIGQRIYLGNSFVMT